MGNRKIGTGLGRQDGVQYAWVSSNNQKANLMSGGHHWWAPGGFHNSERMVVKGINHNASVIGGPEPVGSVYT